MRSCAHCQDNLYDEETGKPVLRRGQPVNRPSVTPPPCRTSKGCPKGTPEAPRTLNERNTQAYAHYLECKATGNFPDDPIVKYNAAIIAAIEQRDERHRQESMQAHIRAAMQMGGGF